MSDVLSRKENEDILTVHDDDQAVEADPSTDVTYDPLDSDSNVVSVEPPIISIGRAERAKELRKQREQG